uniref:Uncharacterized protein n=1 Tax=Anguilla anguilla TaxID=7936 RepID=A0A0E9WTJ7_ANGAN
MYLMSLQLCRSSTAFHSMTFKTFDFINSIMSRTSPPQFVHLTGDTYLNCMKMK